MRACSTRRSALCVANSSDVSLPNSKCRILVGADVEELVGWLMVVEFKSGDSKEATSRDDFRYIYSNRQPTPDSCPTAST